MREAKKKNIFTVVKITGEANIKASNQTPKTALTMLLTVQRVRDFIGKTMTTNLEQRKKFLRRAKGKTA